MSFLGEIKQRSVFRVAAVYAVVAWLIIQVVDVLNDPLSLPAAFDTVVIVLVGIGFPIAMVLAWVFDLTPDGIVRTGTVSSTTLPVAPSVTSRESAPDLKHARRAGTRQWSEPRKEILRNSVAVLPLENLSPNPNDAFFAAGIHGEILNQLAKIKDLSVIARTSVKRYHETEKSIAEIAAELGVGTIMEGSVRYAGKRVRVTAQLIDALTENHLWSEVYERDLADVFAIQADVAEKIAAALEAEFSVAEKSILAKPPTNSPEAYALYLRAVAIMQYGEYVGGSQELRSSSQSYLDQAIALDPEFAPAYVERARLSVYRLHQDPGVQQDGTTPRAELEAVALQDVHKALALDPDTGAAQGILARIHQFNWRGSEARAAYLRALELAPNDPGLRMDFAVFCAMTDRSREATRHAKQAISLDPNSGPAHVLQGFVQLFAHDARAATEAARRAVALSPAFGMPHILLGAMESERGHDEEALEETRLGEHLVGDATNPVLLGHVAYNYSMLGFQEDVERIVHALEQMAVTRRIPSVAWIFAYHALGDEERTLHWLKAAGDNPEPYVGHYGLMYFKLNVFADPSLDRPRFRAARERLGFRDQGVTNSL